MLRALLAAGLAVAAAAPAVAQADPEVDSLLAADRAWAEAVASSDDPAAAYAAMLDAGVIVFGPEGPATEGVDAAVEDFAELAATPGFALSWEPATAAVSDDGTLGYTVGVGRLSMSGDDGEAVTATLNYVTVWRKQADGAWTVVVDAVSPGAAAQAP